MLAISRDITAARNAELRLQASEARFRSLVTATSAIVWNCPSIGAFDSAQPAWEAFTGQAFADYRGTGWLDAVHPDDHAVTLAAWHGAADNGAVFHLRHRLRRSDGQYRCMDVRGVPVLDAAGRVIEWTGTHTDITGEVEARAERDRLHKEVEAAGDRMADIFRQAPAFICVLRGPDHVFELVNDRYAQLVGNRDVVGQPVRLALPEIDGQGFFELLDRVYGTGEPFYGFDMPVLLQREPGVALEQRFLDLVYMALRDADGKVTGILAHGVDQTHRKLAELELHAKRERFEKLVNQAATGVVEMDVSGRITFVNRKYATMLGYEPDELVGRSVIDLTSSASLQATRNAIGSLLADGVEAMVDKHYIHRDGTQVPATSSINVLRAPDGSIHGVVAIVLDMSERTRAAQALHASEERYRTLFESMDQGFCIVDMIFDAAGQPVDYRFVEMNTMFERHTGLANAVGRTAKELVPGLDCFWIETYGRVAQTGEPIRFESEVAAMGRWFDVYATCIGAPGSGCVALLFSDVTERRYADEHLRRLAADLEQSDRRKTEFLATLAHELRNPLAPIRSGLGVMRLGGDNPATVARVHAMMDRQVGHMVRLIDDLLDIARISGGKLELKRAHVDLVQVLHSAIETSRPMIEAGKHAFHADMGTGALMADIDATRISQVIANLLNNAAKYTPPGGTIELTLRRTGNRALISVTDSGVGIPADALAGVFDMFSQVGHSIERAQGGLGIGLSLVRQLVGMHGGVATASSAGTGMGSTFTVTLPLPDSVVDASRTSAQREPGDVSVASGRRRVLLVDDNVDAALTLAMLLEMHGHRVRLVHDGVQAVALAQQFKPELAFVDIGMPRMDGYQTAMAMRRLPGLEQVRLVAVTGWGTDKDRQRAREAGFDHHLTKPANLVDIDGILAGLGRYDLQVG